MAVLIADVVSERWRCGAYDLNRIFNEALIALVTRLLRDLHIVRQLVFLLVIGHLSARIAAIDFHIS